MSMGHICPNNAYSTVYCVCYSVPYTELLLAFNKDSLRGGGGGVDHFCFCSLKKLFLLHCVPLYVCRLCINYQDLSTNLLGVAALCILLLTFISNIVIDFLFIRKL